MSGEAVIFSPFMLDVAAGWRAAEAYIEQQRLEAERRQREEKRRLAEWAGFQQQQRRQMEQLEGRRGELERTLQGLRLHQPAPPPTGESRDAQSRGFLEPATAIASRRERLQALLQQLPAELEPEARLLFERLRREGEGLAARFAQGDAPAEGELTAFQALLSNTLEQQLRWNEQQRAERGRLLAQGEALLDRILHYQALAAGGESAQALAQLRDQLLQPLGAGDLTLGLLDALQRGFEPLRAQVDAALERAAALATLRDALHRHLHGLGYQHQATAQPGRERWAIPGGEQVTVAVQPNLRVAFQLAHERTQTGGGALSEAELAHLRRQEARWCGDLKALLERLRADGFQYQVELERQIPTDTIPIVIVEEAEELLEEMARWDEPKHRSLG